MQSGSHESAYRAMRMAFDRLARSMTIAGAATLATLPAVAVADSEQELRKIVEELRQEVKALKEQVAAQGQQVQTQGKQIEETKAAVGKEDTSPAFAGIKPSFGGQYRINAYSVDNDQPGEEDRQNASRVRIRQNIDLKFSEDLKTHLQLELGHTTDNVTTTAGSDRGTNVNVRHAVIDYTTGGPAVNFQAGIVPLGDNFGDALFSSDWDYNPVAVSMTAPLGSGKLRAFGATLHETIGAGGETVSEDDTTHYQLDYLLPIGEHQINLGLSYVLLTPDAGPSFENEDSFNYGIGGRFKLPADFGLNAFVVGSHTDGTIFDPTGALGTDDGEGVAVKAELTGGLGRGNFGLMVTHATGDSDGNGFIPVMALSRANGYWGYTGFLTVQGPTDTGIDGDSVNISNNGYGLTTVQGKYAYPFTDRFSAYLAAGWFGNTDAPNRDSDVGVDMLLMGTYRLTKYLALDFGGGYAWLEDSVSGYSNGIIGTAGFNQAVGESRDKSGVFARLQAEF